MCFSSTTPQHSGDIESVCAVILDSGVLVQMLVCLLGTNLSIHPTVSRRHVPM
ncbi:hypothetical protein C8R45DRAFT_1224840 [Mycena sanguinolenta]|nr:hypothetical protein C8R45DRAFT_1224840 [Mycena sanguinolenta]